MDLKQEILREHSKSNVVAVVRLIGEDEILFKELMEIFFDRKNMDMARRAAWIIRNSIHSYPHLMEPYTGRMIRYLRHHGLHDAIKRNTLGVLLETGIPGEWIGEITDLCFTYLENRRESIAIRAFSMRILYQVGKRFPEINRELQLILQDLYQYGSAGLQSTAKKIMDNK